MPRLHQATLGYELDVSPGDVPVEQREWCAGIRGLCRRVPTGQLAELL
jgi:hypothetical protein